MHFFIDANSGDERSPSTSDNNIVGTSISEDHHPKLDNPTDDYLADANDFGESIGKDLIDDKLRLDGEQTV